MSTSRLLPLIFPPLYTVLMWSLPGCKDEDSPVRLGPSSDIVAMPITGSEIIGRRTSSAKIRATLSAKNTCTPVTTAASTEATTATAIAMELLLSHQRPIQSTNVSPIHVRMAPALILPVGTDAIVSLGGLGATATRILMTALPARVPTGSVSTRSMAILALVRKDGEEMTVISILTSVRTILATKMLCAPIQPAVFSANA